MWDGVVSFFADIIVLLGQCMEAYIALVDVLGPTSSISAIKACILHLYVCLDHPLSKQSKHVE